MKSIQKITGIFMAAAAILALSGTAGFAKLLPQSDFGSSDLIVLTQNHGGPSPMILIPADRALNIPACFNLDQSTGADNLSIICANTTPMTKGDEIIYFVSGFVNATPCVCNMSTASGGTFSASCPTVPEISDGVLFTGVLYTTGGVDYPITLVSYTVPANCLSTCTTTSVKTHCCCRNIQSLEERCFLKAFLIFRQRMQSAGRA